MIAIIAEKPSLAANIVAGIGKMQKKNGYYENSEYIVTWAYGHLFSLCDIEDYSDKKAESARWTMDNLPCIPDHFRFKLKTDNGGGIKRQFETIKAILSRKDVTKIVNAGDSDREGEIIIRLCISNALKSPKPVYRLWLPDQTPQTVRKALEEMQPDEKYDNLADEGFARTYIDWLYGVNLTRYVTLKSGALLRVGRVIVPIVKAVFDRDKEIENFKPETYYALVSSVEFNGETIELVSKYKFPENEYEKAKICVERMNKLECVVTDKKSTKDKVPAGKLYSLTKLQNNLGKKYKMPMPKSLAIAQKLYEQGYISYPRTNSEYLATNEKSKIKKIISDIANLGYPIVFKDNKSIFDDGKIESHSAITPTYKIPDKNSLGSDEYIVYQAILRRFVAVFCKEDCIQEKTEITLDLGGKEQYSLKGNTILQQGWTKYDGFEKKDKFLPKLNVGDRIPVNFKPEKKQTSPPKHYTIETLNNYLKNPFKTDLSEENGDEEEYKAIFKGLELGTEATRTGIIENAQKNGYISLKKDVYHIENNGKFLIGQLENLSIAMDKYKTSEMGQALKKVYHGEITVKESVNIAEKEILNVFKNEGNSDIPSFGEYICKCPKCGNEVIKGKYAYGCKGYKDGCDFKINQTILGAVITKSDVLKVISSGRTDKKEFTSKSGKKFSCELVFDKDFNLKFDIK